MLVFLLLFENDSLMSSHEKKQFENIFVLMLACTPRAVSSWLSDQGCASLKHLESARCGILLMALALMLTYHADSFFQNTE